MTGQTITLDTHYDETVTEHTHDMEDSDKAPNN